MGATSTQVALSDDLSTWVVALVVYPVLEEVVFRYGLLDWLDRRPNAWPTLANNVVASVVFCLAHWATWGGLQAAAVFTPSLALGWTWQRWRSLWRCALLHSLFNAAGLALVHPG